MDLALAMANSVTDVLDFMQITKLTKGLSKNGTWRVKMVTRTNSVYGSGSFLSMKL